ncbi:MAG: T9SS-dependent M36 family metallopeptidase [Bacteroidetes bacterium]|nr:T9SS-dependent M36 family metallopeptidase [Bacteroidota bacterium]
MKQILTLLLCICVISSSLFAQDASATVARYLSDHKDKWGLSAEEAAHDWYISDQYTTDQITRVYLQQTIYGLKLYNAVSTAVLKDGKVVVFNSRFTPRTIGMTNARPAMNVLSEEDAIWPAAKDIQLSISNLKETVSDRPDVKERVFTADGGIKQPIRVSAIYQKMADQIRLAWNVEIQVNSDWWNIRVDALTGVVLDKSNYTVYCEFGREAFGRIQAAGCISANEYFKQVDATLGMNAQASYRVFPFPGESPNHIAHQIITDPADVVASPYGWHDTDGVEGAEYTITRGNNVYASEDRDDDDLPGYSPDGGAALVFDFPYTPQQSPVLWEDAAITNLFYANNFMHDLSYRYGFTEEAGNYQENNYGHSGEAGDAVQADAQDGSGTNNANFSPPPDGIPGRMQMYLWTVATSDSITIDSPSGIAGVYFAPRSGFGLPVTDPLTSEVVLVEDDVAPTSDGCDLIQNGIDLFGKIAILERGNCNFVTKVLAAQNEGAIGAIVINNVAGAPFSMGGNDPSIFIPSAMVSQETGNLILAALENGPVTITIQPPQGDADHDSDVDNGIIAHEYAHGISTRLTGGPDNSDCLNNEEQMGEGWSDWYALVTTIRDGDDRFTLRPMGTYALGESPNGGGIRNQIYTTDMSVCTYTYDDLPATGGEVHNTGELWTAMLWDMTWDLIDQYGYDADMFNGTGGNNIALKLVTIGMSLQACSPGFVDGRDAILAADELLYNGANKCLIWAAFARRGLGFSADQGSSNDYSDGTGAFDLPPACLIAEFAPVADFSVDRTTACVGLATFQFTDESQNIAQQWLWDFGDGTTSSETNPVHEYAEAGVYTVKLTVTNNIGVDSTTFTDLISVNVIPAPSVSPVNTVCSGQSASLTAGLSGQGTVAEWRDSDGNLVYTGTPFVTPPLLATTTYSVSEAENVPVQHVGPAGPGTGSNHNTAFLAEILFTAEKAFTLKSALVRAQGAGPREVRLLDDSGNALITKIIDIPNGESRIDLNMDVPSAGDYSLAAGPNTNLYRDNAGVQYPFTIPGLVTITNSNAGQAGFYYYFYDWEVQETPCRSDESAVTVEVTPGPVAGFTTTQNGLTVTFTNTSTGNPTNYLWNFGDNTTSTLPNPTHTYATPGVYTVTLTVSTGGCVTEFSQAIGFTGTNTPGSAPFDVSLAPNPATGKTFLRLSGAPNGRFVQVGLYSVDGRLVRSDRFDNTPANALPMDISGLAAGMYMVKVQAENGVVMRKLVVE